MDTAGFNDRSWLDDAGHAHSDALHTVERFRRRDFGHMDLEVVIDDSKAYTMPWSFTLHFLLLPDTELIEDVCDNEKDAGHSIGRAANEGKNEVTVAPEILSGYVGAYEFKMPGDDTPQVFDVSMAGDRLVFFGSELAVLSETEFAAVFGSLKFVKDDRGVVTHLIVKGAGPVDLTGVRKSAFAAGAQK